MFSQYESLPRKVNAVQFTDKNKDQVFNSLTGRYSPDFEDGKPIIRVTTIHGEIAIVRIGDWIVKEKKIGYYYPVKNDVFCDTYI